MDDTFRKLSSLFLAAALAGVSASNFVNADSNFQAVPSAGDEDIEAAVAGTQADSSGGDDRPDEVVATRSYSTGELADALSFIRRSCGDMEGTGLSHLDILEKIETSA